MYTFVLLNFDSESQVKAFLGSSPRTKQFSERDVATKDRNDCSDVRDD